MLSIRKMVEQWFLVHKEKNWARSSKRKRQRLGTYRHPIDYSWASIEKTSRQLGLSVVEFLGKELGKEIEEIAQCFGFKTIGDLGHDLRGLNLTIDDAIAFLGRHGRGAVAAATQANANPITEIGKWKDIALRAGTYTYAHKLGTVIFH